MTFAASRVLLGGRLVEERGTACIVCCVQLRLGERFGRVVNFEEICQRALLSASNSCKMVLKGFLYNTVFRRNSTYAAFIVAGAVLGEKFLNDVVDANWRESNKGVRYLPHNSFCCSSSVLRLPHPSMLSASPSYFTSFSETVQRPRVRSIQMKGSNIFIKAHLKISCSPHAVASFSKQHVESLHCTAAPTKCRRTEVN
jgi:hypothetical protein